MTDEHVTDKTREALSAFIDGESDELEVRRVLNQLEEGDELRETWQRYQLIGSLIREEDTLKVDLSRGIRQTLDSESGTSSMYSGWLTSAAVAASVTLAVLLGVQTVQQSSQPSPRLVQQPVEQQAPVSQQELAEAQRKLQQYVQQHAEHASLNTGRGVMPFARVTSFEEQAKETESSSEPSADE